MGARWEGNVMPRPLPEGSQAPIFGSIAEQRAVAAMRRERDAALAKIQALRDAIGDHMVATVAAGRPSNADEALWAC